MQWENLSCHGFDDGYVWDIVATGGTWPYEYSIDAQDILHGCVIIKIHHVQRLCVYRT